MNIQRYSRHMVTSEDTFSFNPSEYSRFKFGDGAISKKYGIELAEGFIDQCLRRQKEIGQLVVISSPFAFIPTATFAMKNHFVNRLNRWLAANSLPVVQKTKIHRKVTYKEDYGALDAEQRMKLIGNDKFHIDKEFIKDKTLIFLDDIRITGSHEKMILKMSQEYGIDNNAWLLYFAELQDLSIHPKIENFLNYYQVKDLDDLNDIVQNPGFQINTRITKYILNADTKKFDNFIRNQTPDFIELLYNMAIGNEYHLIEAYLTNLSKIKHPISNLVY
ncbi:hypothetical protein D3C72_1182980 [compost metagenome]